MKRLQLLFGKSFWFDKAPMSGTIRLLSGAGLILWAFCTILRMMTEFLKTKGERFELLLSILNPSPCPTFLGKNPHATS